MIITCMQALPIQYRDRAGVVKTVVLRPGSYPYPMLDHKDPMVAEQLRVFRKHTRIGFDEILESDKPVLESIPKDADRAAELLRATGLKESPVGKKVMGKKKSAKKSPKHDKHVGKPEPKTSEGKSDGGLSK